MTCGKAMSCMARMSEVSGKQKKTYLIAFLDDNSRLIPHAEFYFHEQLKCFLDCLQKSAF